MKPYYEDSKSGIVIYHGDCREIMPSLPKVDLVLTDPPYGIGEEYKNYSDSQSHLNELVESVMPIILDRSSRAAITPGVANISKYPNPKWILAWVTPAGCGSGPWGFCCWQPILVYGTDPYLACGKGRKPDIIQCTEAAEKNGHPCPKPIELWRRILNRVSESNSDIVLDPFVGSGTTLRAAKDLGRRAIGIDICEEYCEISARRLAQEVFAF